MGTPDWRLLTAADIDAGWKLVELRRILGDAPFNVGPERHLLSKRDLIGFLRGDGSDREALLRAARKRRETKLQQDLTQRNRTSNDQEQAILTATEGKRYVLIKTAGSEPFTDDLTGERGRTARVLLAESGETMTVKASTLAILGAAGRVGDPSNLLNSRRTAAKPAHAGGKLTIEDLLQAD